MKILRIAPRAIFLAMLPALSVSAQAPGDTYDPLRPAGADALPSVVQNPASNAVETSPPIPAASTASSTAPTPWYDSIFQQKLPIDFGFEIKGIHSDNIFFQEHKSEDYFTEISPSMILTLGDPIALAPALDQETINEEKDAAHLNFVQVTYRPTLRLFDKHSKLDDVDEDADAIISHQFSRLTLSLEQSYLKLSQPTVQINTPGGLINRDIFTTTAKANYIYSDQLSTYGTLSQTVSHYIGTAYNDNTEWVADYYFLYQLFPKLSVGLGPRIGFDDVDRAPNQTFQTGLVHFFYPATGKFTVAGAGGAEVRQYEHDSSPERVTPVVEGVATYHPFDSMTITLDGKRHRIVSNGTIGQDYESSTGTLKLKQRFFQVVFATLSATYENDDYTGTGPIGTGNGPTRDDNIYYLKSGLEWDSFRGLTIEAGYTYLHDDSNIKAFSFDESRATISANFKY